MKKVKWGIVGTGKIAGKFANDLKYSNHGELAAVGSRSMNSANDFRSKYPCDNAYGTYEELYADPEIEAVYVATPHNFHLQNATDAMRAGKAVLCEKPIGVNLREAETIFTEAKKTNQYLMEGMWMYFLPSILKAKEWVHSGAIGDITHIKADFGFKAPYNPEGRLFNQELAGGAILDIGIYPIAFAWLFMQKDPSRIIVSGRKAPTGVDLESAYLFEYDDLTASLSCSLRCQLPNFAYIVGTEGYVQIPSFWMSEEALLYKGGNLVDHFKAPRDSFGYDYEIDAVCQDIRAGKKQSDIMPHAYSLKLQAHMMAVLEQI